MHNTEVYTVVFFVNIKIYREFNIFVTGVDLWQLKTV